MNVAHMSPHGVVGRLFEVVQVVADVFFNRRLCFSLESLY